MAKVPQSTGLDFGVGLVKRNGRLRGSLSAAAKINETVSLVANAHAASSQDWSAMAGLKVRW